MILIDYSQTAIAAICSQVGFGPQQVQLNEDMCRHMILNSIRARFVQFKNEFGPEMIIACDSKHIWRKDIFPYYKIRRAKERDDSPLDWKLIYETLAKVREEIKEFFPYPVVMVHGAEADDVIGTLCCHLGVRDFGGEPLVIVSKDKDFIGLQQFVNVKQYNSTEQKFIVSNDPEKDLKQLILNGDSGDDVPNVLSPDDCFATKSRQKPMTQKRLSELLPLDPEFYDTQIKKNYFRNKKLIDLTEIPINIQEEIMKEYNKQKGKDRKKLMNYFMDRRLSNLLESLSDF